LKGFDDGKVRDYFTLAKLLKNNKEKKEYALTFYCIFVQVMVVKIKITIQGKE
jgi:hypothetical protein